MILNYGSSCLYLPGTGITGVRHRAEQMCFWFQSPCYMWKNRCHEAIGREYANNIEQPWHLELKNWSFIRSEELDQQLSASCYSRGPKVLFPTLALGGSQLPVALVPVGSYITSGLPRAPALHISCTFFCFVFFFEIGFLLVAVAVLELCRLRDLPVSASWVLD